MTNVYAGQPSEATTVAAVALQKKKRENLGHPVTAQNLPIPLSHVRYETTYPIVT